MIFNNDLDHVSVKVENLQTHLYIEDERNGKRGQLNGAEAKVGKTGFKGIAIPFVVPTKMAE